jgi:membrane fusion protein, multidrug efflux system
VRRCLRFAVVGLSALVLIAGCNRNKEETKAAAPELQLSAEDLVSVESGSLAVGPQITGSILPERRADLRAEVSAVVLSVEKENGEPVKRGDLLVRLDATAIRDSLTAAQASAQAADQALDQSERQYQRLLKLRDGGLVSTQQVEDTEIRRNAAQSEKAANNTRVVTARQQLSRTLVRAPFDGIVIERKVSAGDTAGIEGLVPAGSIGAVKVGQGVNFTITGFGTRQFVGRVSRVSPAADAATRQVEVIVEFADPKQRPTVAGLYAEGRIATEERGALMLPASSLVREGDNAFTWRLVDGAIQKVAIVLGERDPRSGNYAVLQGLAANDRLIRHPNTSLQDGQKASLAGS